MANRFEVDQRAALFGARGKAPAKGKEDKYAANSRAMMEQQNDQHIEDLEAKVSALKDITMGINREVNDSNRLLDGMSLDFDKAGALLKGTVQHLKVMMQNRSGKHMWYMAAFVVFLFICMWFISKGRGSKPAPSINVVEQNTSSG